MIKKVSKINKVEFIRSDISGKLFPADKCEMVVIKIVKGKDEDINDYSPFNRESPHNFSNEKSFEIYRKNEIIDNEIESSSIIPPALRDLNPDKIDKVIRRATSIIPPQHADIFKKPDGL